MVLVYESLFEIHLQMQLVASEGESGFTVTPLSPFYKKFFFSEPDLPGFSILSVIALIF